MGQRIFLFIVMTFVVGCNNDPTSSTNNNGKNPISGLNPGDSIYMGCWKGIIPPGADTSDSVCRHELTGTGIIDSTFFYTVCI